MPLRPGEKLGPYEITALLGKGGMGEVYKAHDSRLHRDVAIKVSAEEFSDRFSREARAIAALNHTNVCHLYDVGPNYLVMEYVEGADLCGPMEFDDALPLIRQLIDGIEAAHEKGIIHRDLKPANIKVTPDGVVKILDFGLARLDALPSSDPENSPTLSMAATVAGTILGTAAYMSPEQAKGKKADRRSDIWAFGVILFELLTGKRLFQGESTVEILGGMLNKDIDISSAPLRVHGLLRWCLERDRKNRLAAIGDARRLLDEAPVAAATGPAHVPSKLPWIAAAAALCIAVGMAFVHFRQTAPPLRPLMRLNVEIARGMTLAGGVVVNGNSGHAIAISPDGMRLALTLRGPDGKVRLHSRLVQHSQFVPITGSDGAHGPFFSPDGAWIGYFADGKLKKVAVEGGASVTLCDAPAAVGGSWGDDGNIVVALSTTSVLSKVPSAGGTPVALTKFNAGESTHRWPHMLPGSHAVLFTAAERGTGTRSYDPANIEAVSVKTGERKTIARGGYFPKYVPAVAGSSEPGHLLYVHQTTLFAAPFDPVRLAIAGPPVPILDDLGRGGLTGGRFAFAGAAPGPGTFVYLAESRDTDVWPISWFDSSGKTQPLQAPPAKYISLRFSPDGRRFAYSTTSDIWVREIDRDTPSRLTFLPGSVQDPVWTPDGKHIVFESRGQPAPGLYIVPSDGSGEARLLAQHRPTGTPGSFSPDGKRLAFSMQGKEGLADILTAPFEADPGPGPAKFRLGKPEVFVGTPFQEADPAFSPDGRFLAYSSDESGTQEVYVRQFPGPGARWQVSAGGGLFPRWTKDGRELLYVGPDRRVMAVGYTDSANSFSLGKPRRWSEIRVVGSTGNLAFDLTPDGKRIAANVADGTDAASSEPTHLTFLLHFADELRRRTAAGK